MAPLRILVAEDEPLSALALEAQVRVLGHLPVGPASMGEEAIGLARESEVDLAILDIGLPNEPGLEAAEAIFRVRPIPIILLAEYGEGETAGRLRRTPVFHYLIKPVTREDLAPAIGVAIRRFREWQSLREEIRDLEERLGERKIVERAKGTLMETLGLRYDEAAALLERRSAERGEPVVEIARTLLTSEALLRDPAPS